MKRFLAIILVLSMLTPVSVGAVDLELELDPVEQELLMDRRIPPPDEDVAPSKKGTNWMYILLGVGVLGAAAGGGGGGGGGGSSTDGSMEFTW